jgi:hypothetical protein
MIGRNMTDNEGPEMQKRVREIQRLGKGNPTALAPPNVC